MSAPETPTASESRSRKRPWGWMAFAGLLAVAVVALAIYASNVNSDLDDANAKVASQQKEIDKAQDTGADVAAAARTAYDQLSQELGAVQEDAGQAVDEATQQLDQAEQDAADAKGTADELQKDADAAKAKADAAATCAQSFLEAFKGVFNGSTLEEGVEAAVAELEKLQPQCAPALAEGGA